MPESIPIGRIQSAFSIGEPSTSTMLELGTGLTGDFCELLTGLNFLGFELALNRLNSNELETKVRRQVPEAGMCQHRSPFIGRKLSVPVSIQDETRDLSIPIALCNLPESEAGVSLPDGHRACGRVCHSSSCKQSPKYTSGGY